MQTMTELKQSYNDGDIDENELAAKYALIRIHECRAEVNIKNVSFWLSAFNSDTRTSNRIEFDIDKALKLALETL